VNQGLGTGQPLRGGRAGRIDRLVLLRYQGATWDVLELVMLVAVRVAVVRGGQVRKLQSRGQGHTDS
jgi:hypothetical protein